MSVPRLHFDFMQHKCECIYALVKARKMLPLEWLWLSAFENYVCCKSVKDVGGRGINLRVITYQWDENDDNLSRKGHFNTICLSLVGLSHLKGDFIFIVPKSGLPKVFDDWCCLPSNIMSMSDKLQANLLSAAGVLLIYSWWSCSDPVWSLWLIMWLLSHLFQRLMKFSFLPLDNMSGGTVDGVWRRAAEGF